MNALQHVGASRSNPLMSRLLANVRGHHHIGDLLCLLDALANEAGLERRRRFGLVVATGIIMYLLTGFTR